MDKTPKRPCAPIPTKLAYSIDEMRCLFGISRSLLYKLLQQGDGPKTLKVGARTLISHDAAYAWKREMEERVEEVR
jgi:hypothetical protein